ncbi:alkene reductase [Niastella yeongjuensis]|uniref:Alkene reductase n=1 Tax=Niastella yeongjuensis TaxID=354355 RepID=A0A1V9ESC1_9BACT|nr:alkene reductase [Niastella yeongjuensis]OQP49016.1 alkene reductase [Niastella yeongjuensis]SEP10430.1 N-ethylmaleimide reductase [Niastella yeongjuensis]
MIEQPLLETFDLNGLQLKNRVVMAPMTRTRSDNPGNMATELTAKYYEQRASAGLIITEGTYISREAIGFINVPGIYTDLQVEGWKLVTDAVHAKAGKIFAQLWHVGRMSHPDLLDGNLPLAPSALNPYDKAYGANGFLDTLTAREMSFDDIHRTIADFKQGAKNAIAAGFDGIELHAANGYLLHQFFNLYSNKRSDIYGGTIENRARILFEILEELKEVISLQKVGVRLNPSLHNAQGMMLDEESITVHEYIVRELNSYDLAYIHLTEPYTQVADHPFAVAEIAKHFRPLYNGNIIINKGFSRETGNVVIKDNLADLVAFGAPFIANPDLVERFKTDAPLNAPDPSTFYGVGPKGYTDYPSLSDIIDITKDDVKKK